MYHFFLFLFSFLDADSLNGAIVNLGNEPGAMSFHFRDFVVNCMEFRHQTRHSILSLLVVCLDLVKVAGQRRRLREQVESVFNLLARVMFSNGLMVWKLFVCCFIPYPSPLFFFIGLC